MTSVYLADVGLGFGPRSTPERFRELARRDAIGRHALSSDPGSADLILFTEAHQLGADWRIERIVRHPLYRSYRTKCFSYDERDRPLCTLPGLYVSLDRRNCHRRLQRAWSYFHVSDRGPASNQPSLLFSFVGSPTHPIRKAILTLSHPNAHVERVENFLFWDPETPQYEERRVRFQEILDDSSFVICPRGHGTSSIRLFETMAAGRVPVVLSDFWVPPAGPAWDDFVVRWPEGDLEGLTQHLESLASEAGDMGRRARAEYDAHFAPAVYFDRTVQQLSELAEAKPGRAYSILAAHDLTFARRSAGGFWRTHGPIKRAQRATGHRAISPAVSGERANELH